MAPLDKDDPRLEKEIMLNGKPFPIKKVGKSWYLKKELDKVIGGVKMIAVKPSKETWINFKKNPSIEYDIGKPDDTGTSLDLLLKIIMDLKAGVHRDVGKFDNTDFQDMELLGKNTVAKYLKVAEWAGLDPASIARKAKEGKTDFGIGKGEKKELLGHKLSKQFLEDKAYRRWQEKFEKNRGRQYKRNLFNALRLMGYTPTTFLHFPSNMNPLDYLDEIKHRMMPLRYWSENPYAKTVQGGKRKLKLKNRFENNAETQWVNNDTVKRLQKWDVNPPLETIDGEKGMTEISDRNNPTMYKFAKVLRNFIVANGISVPNQAITDILSQEAPNVAAHGKLKLTWDQIIGMKKCLLENMKAETKTVNIKREGKQFEPKGEVDVFDDLYDAKSYWHDAYFFFMLALEMGMRAEEGFDIIAEPPINENSSGVLIEPDAKGKNIYKIFLYTRKTERVKEGKIHEGWIPNSADGKIVEKFIDDRLEQIKKGHKIQIWKTGETGKVKQNIHALIGADNKYTVLDTIALPSNRVKTKGTRRTIIANCLRHCYQVVEANDGYYFDKPLHALRHVFAQYWLNKSGWNYTFVAKLGHWHTLGVLEKSYGKMSNEIFYADQQIFADISPTDTPEEVAANIARKKSGKDKKPPTVKSKSTVKKEKKTEDDFGAAHETTEPSETFDDPNNTEPEPELTTAEIK